MKEIIINEKNSGQRLDKFLQRLLCNESPSFVYKMLRKKNITLNDKKSDGKDILESNDIVKIWFSDETYEKLTKREGDIRVNAELNIIYEDDNMALINKPVGVLTQKANVSDISLNELFVSYLLNKGELTNADLNFYKPSAVNRLDRNTSGIVVCAKNLRAAQILSDGFKNRTINKYYKCLVHGTVSSGNLIKGYLKKNEKTNKVFISNKKDKDSSYIETEYKPVDINKEKGYISEKINDYSLLEIHLITGKTHQIRAHLASIGHPLAGDRKYGVNDQFKYQCLHCYKIEFPKYDDNENILANISEKVFYGDLEKPWA